MLVLGSLILLVLLIAVMRAAASARGDQAGAVCFLSKLGIQIGAGCSSSKAGATKAVVSQALGELVEVTPRVKDIEPSIPSTTSGGSLKGGGAASEAAAVGTGGSPAQQSGLHRILRLWL